MNKEKRNEKECKHSSICDGGYGRKRCTCCGAIIQDERSDFIDKAPKGMFSITY